MPTAVTVLLHQVQPATPGAVVSRQPDDYPYPPDEGQTHSEGCWQNSRHHNCAVDKVDRLTARVAELEADAKAMDDDPYKGMTPWYPS